MPCARSAPRARSHEVSCPQTLPIRRDPPLPGFAFLGHVASLYLPCTSTPYSLDGLPGVLPTRRARGVTRPSELDLAEIVTVSRCDFPSCDWLPSRVQQTHSLLHSHLPETGQSAGTAPRTGQLRPVPLGSMALAALSAHEALLHSAASLQGLHPSAGWGCRQRISPPRSALALLGFASLGRSPSLPSGPKKPPSLP
jgi:hypothetical protein